VHGAAGKRCAISIFRRGFQASHKGRTELRGGSAQTQDGGNTGASMMPPAAITGMSSCRARRRVRAIVPRRLSGAGTPKWKLTTFGFFGLVNQLYFLCITPCPKEYFRFTGKVEG